MLFWARTGPSTSVDGRHEFLEATEQNPGCPCPCPDGRLRSLSQQCSGVRVDQTVPLIGVDSGTRLCRVWPSSEELTENAPNPSGRVAWLRGTPPHHSGGWDRRRIEDEHPPSSSRVDHICAVVHHSRCYRSVPVGYQRALFSFHLHVLNRTSTADSRLCRPLWAGRLSFEYGCTPNAGG